MQLVFTQEYLFNLYHNQATDKHHRFQPEVIKKYIKVVNIVQFFELRETVRGQVWRRISADRGCLQYFGIVKPLSIRLW